jgi:hypothetical protein
VDWMSEFMILEMGNHFLWLRVGFTSQPGGTECLLCRGLLLGAGGHTGVTNSLYHLLNFKLENALTWLGLRCHKLLDT